MATDTCPFSVLYGFAAHEEIIVNLPQLAESITEGEVGEIEVEVGDYVAMDAPVVNIETDKLAVPTWAVCGQWLMLKNVGH